MTPREALAAAFAAQPAAYRSLFGVSTSPARRHATVFLWRNYLTGECGELGRACEEELVTVAVSLLKELETLRTERKPMQKAYRKPQQKRAS